jgi:anti-anti-sigma factor
MNATWKLAIGRDVQDGVAVLTVHGRVGTAASGQFVEAVLDMVQGGYRRILLDLSGVDYVSSAGLVALDAVAGRIHEVEGTLVLCALTEPVRLVLDLAGLLPHFVVVASRDAGLARLAQ